MSRNLDAVLDTIDALDVGQQKSREHGYGTDLFPDECARCQVNAPVESGDLCGGCRAFLLGDTDIDPMPGTVLAEWNASMATLRTTLATNGTSLDELAEAANRVAVTLMNAFRPIVVRVTGFFALHAQWLVDAGLMEPPREHRDWRAERLTAARQWEQAMLSEHRRSHRRTNRWPAEPRR